MGLLDSVVEGVPPSKVICNFVGVFYPCIASFNAVRASASTSSTSSSSSGASASRAAAVADVQLQWLVYWVVAAIFLLAESVFDIVLAGGFGGGGGGSGGGGGWLLPLYYEAKTVFVVWLTIPGFDGAAVLYRRYLAPFLQQHERAIDAQIDRAAAGAGAQLQRARSHGGDFLRARGESIFRAASDAASGMLAPTAEAAAAAAAAGDDGCDSEAECEVAGEMKAEGTGLRQRKRK
jgi:hypothetical protein